MATDKKKHYNLDNGETSFRPSSTSKKRNTTRTITNSSGSQFDTELLSRNLEEQADSHISKTRRDTTYSTGPLPTETVSSSRRQNRSNSGRLSRPAAEAVARDEAAEERYRERKRQRKEAARWQRAHWIVRFLIVFVLILDVLLFRFGIFKGGFMPVWNILTAKGNTTTTEESADSSGVQINEQLLTINEYSRPGTALTAINGIVVHYIGNPGTDAQANRDYFENLKDGSTGVYGSCNYIIGLDGTIIQCVPDNEVAYASGERNNDTISIECCHPDESGAFTAETFNSLVQLTAQLCREYNLSTDQILRHYDVNQKPCPKYFVDDSDAWSNFIASVESCM